MFYLRKQSYSIGFYKSPSVYILYDLKVNTTLLSLKNSAYIFVGMTVKYVFKIEHTTTSSKQTISESRVGLPNNFLYYDLKSTTFLSGFRSQVR